MQELSSFIQARSNVSPRRLAAPGPGRDELEQLLTLAAAAPDHGQLAPWRFVLVPMSARDRLADAFGLALLGRDPQASEEEVGRAREKAWRAPTLLIAILRTGGDADPRIPALERAVSFGAAIQNVLLGAQAMGYGTGLTSGKAMPSAPLRELCSLAPEEHAVCCINIGTAVAARAARTNRRQPSDILSELAPRRVLQAA
ncbi:nitroreductase [Caenimonas sedimenti]|uniref:Putative NAD(P)H nitroreductase n=1 Tax=Caenimonas sedimenti TaxID=2596921 RepID=A0A562ZKS8_9BURK|nr:nitroreductase [Caenimonas sedimenti]